MSLPIYRLPGNTTKPESESTTTKQMTTVRTTISVTHTPETSKTTKDTTTLAAVTHATTYETTENPNTSIPTTKEPTETTKSEAASTASTVDPNHVAVPEDKTVYLSITVTDTDGTTVTTVGPAHSSALKTSQAINNVTEPSKTG